MEASKMPETAEISSAKVLASIRRKGHCKEGDPFSPEQWKYISAGTNGSVNEEVAKRLCESFAGRFCKKVVDPSFMLDVMAAIVKLRSVRDRAARDKAVRARRALRREERPGRDSKPQIRKRDARFFYPRL